MSACQAGQPFAQAHLSKIERLGSSLCGKARADHDLLEDEADDGDPAALALDGLVLLLEA
ncbi:MAG TPA: hypothetical protein PKW52_08580 [Nitrospira sp.]|nr:hypothetical protein [Nitrospira sp.]